MSNLINYIQEGIIRIWYIDTADEDKVMYRVATYGRIFTLEEATKIVGRPTTNFVRRWGHKADSSEDVTAQHNGHVLHLSYVERENTLALSLECSHNKEQ